MALSATGAIISWWQQAVRQVPCWAGAPRACSQRGICVPCAATPVIDRAHGAGAASTGVTIQGNSRSRAIKAIRRTNGRKPRTALQSQAASAIIITQRPSNVNALPSPRLRAALPALTGAPLIHGYILPLQPSGFVSLSRRRDPPSLAGGPRNGRPAPGSPGRGKLPPPLAQTLIHWVRRLKERKEEAIAVVGEKRYRIWAIYVGCRYQYVDRSYREAEVRWEDI